MDNTEENKELRQEFAKAFGWYEEKSDYVFSRTTKELKTPTWAEILVEVGKLLARQHRLDVKETLERHDLAIMEMRNDITNLSLSPKK